MQYQQATSGFCLAVLLFLTVMSAVLVFVSGHKTFDDDDDDDADDDLSGVNSGYADRYFLGSLQLIFTGQIRDAVPVGESTTLIHCRCNDGGTMENGGELAPVPNRSLPRK